jgi:hypothetical protein
LLVLRAVTQVHSNLARVRVQPPVTTTDVIVEIEAIIIGIVWTVGCTYMS